MFNENLVNGMKFSKCDKKMVCYICMKCKSTRLPFPQQSLTKSKAVMDLVHSDVWDQNEAEPLGGSRYLVTFIDDFRYAVTYFLKEKSETEVWYETKNNPLRSRWGVHQWQQYELFEV